MKFDFIFLFLTISIVFVFLCTNNETFDNISSDKSINFNENYIDRNNNNIDYLNLYKKSIENQEKENLLDYINEPLQKIYYNNPVSYTSDLQDTIFDKSVLKNYRVFPYTNTYSQELKYFNIEELLSKFNKNQVYLIGDLDRKFNKIGEHFTDRFNILFFVNDMNNKFHKSDNRKYKMKNIRVLINNKILNYNKIVYEITIYKDLNHYGLVFQNTIKYNITDKTIKYLNLEIVGFVSEKDIYFLKDKPRNSYCKYDIDLSKDECFKLNYNNEIVNRNDFITGKYIEENQKEFEKQLKESNENDIEYKKYKCFRKDGFNESDCKSYDRIKKVTGIWDKPCNNNEECPFYKKK